MLGIFINMPQEEFAFSTSSPLSLNAEALLTILSKKRNTMKSAVQVTKYLAQKAMQTAAPAVSAVASAAVSELIGLKVDGHPVNVARGATLLDAIKKTKSHVPTLCFHPEFDPKAVCECVASLLIRNCPWR